MRIGSISDLQILLIFDNELDFSWQHTKIKFEELETFENDTSN